jgi:ADP-ribose pyrophosphatase YjhB (NUDIX family)
MVQHIHTGKMRPVCPTCNWVYFPDPKVAVVVLIRKDDHILLVQRMFDPQKGDWTLPSGFVDAGEDPKAAARRECLEETGLVIDEPKLLDVIYSHEYPRGASILILYQAQVESGELKPGDDARQAAYFHIHDLPHLAFSSTHLILDLYF